MERVHSLVKVVVLGWLLVVVFVSYAAVEEVGDATTGEGIGKAEVVGEKTTQGAKESSWTDWAKERMPSFSKVATDKAGTAEGSQTVESGKASEKIGSTKDSTLDAAAKAFETAKQKATEAYETARDTVTGQTKPKSEAPKETTSKPADDDKQGSHEEF